MTIDSISELQVYINYIVYENNFKYSNTDEILSDLKKEFNIIVKKEQKIGVYFPVKDFNKKNK